MCHAFLIMTTKLRHNPEAWIAQCRAQQLAKTEFNRTDDGMSHGIIPFGAVRHSLEMAAAERVRILSRPLQARIASDCFATGMVAIAVTCPYCHAQHSYVFDGEALESRLEEPLEAPCGWGTFRVTI